MQSLIHDPTVYSSNEYVVRGRYASGLNVLGASTFSVVMVDATVGEMVDAMVDGMVSAMVDAMVDAMGDAMVNAMVEELRP